MASTQGARGAFSERRLEQKRQVQRNRRACPLNSPKTQTEPKQVWVLEHLGFRFPDPRCSTRKVNYSKTQRKYRISKASFPGSSGKGSHPGHMSRCTSSSLGGRHTRVGTPTLLPLADPASQWKQAILASEATTWLYLLIYSFIFSS